MKQRKCFGGLLAAGLLFLLPYCLNAQATHTEDRTYAVRVQGLKSEDRDALQRDLNDRADLRLVFACVPAGVLVFEGAPAETRQQARQRALPMLEAKALQGRLEELAGGRVEAEAACANARNR
ncbi:MAG: hypothetical protein ACK4L7_09980 [Flavobacteriales bacterium]